MSAIYSDILTYVNGVTGNYITANTAIVANTIAPAVASLLSLYVILWGVASMRGMIQEPITEAAARFIKVALICSLALQLGHYNELVVDTFFNGPEDLARLLTGATSNSSAVAGLDTMLDSGFTVGKSFWDKGGLVMGDVGMYMLALIVWGITIAVTAYACFLIVLAKIMLCIVIALGPIFIVSLLFQATGSYFSGWVQQLANYGLLIIMVVAANVFILTLFQRAAAGASALTSTAQIDQVFPLIITGAISLLVIAQLNNVAAGLAGGLSLSSQGMERLGLSMLSNSARRANTMMRSGLNRISGAFEGKPSPNPLPPRKVPRDPSPKPADYENRENHIGPA